MTNHDFLDNLANNQHQKMLREIANDNQTPKKRDSLKETELFEIDEIISEILLNILWEISDFCCKCFKKLCFIV